jgi:hypothetical protein
MEGQSVYQWDEEVLDINILWKDILCQWYEEVLDIDILYISEVKRSRI